MKLLKVATFLRLVDAHDSTLSLTNICLMVVLVKIAVAPQVGLTEASALFLSLLSHAGKKVINQKTSALVRKDVEESNAKFEQLSSRVESVLADVSKLGTDVSKIQLAQGFKR